MSAITINRAYYLIEAKSHEGKSLKDYSVDESGQIVVFTGVYRWADNTYHTEPETKSDEAKENEKIFKEAVEEAIAKHHKEGRAVPVWRDDKLVWLPPPEKK